MSSGIDFKTLWPRNGHVDSLGVNGRKIGNLSGLYYPSSSAIIFESSASGEGSVNVNSNKPSFRTSISSEPFCQTYLSYLSERVKLRCIHRKKWSKYNQRYLYVEISHPTNKNLIPKDQQKIPNQP